MSEKILTLIISLWYCSGISQNLQLNMPKANYQMAMVSKDDVKWLEFEFRMQGAEIRYTTDGSEPVKKSKKFKNPICISQPCIVKAKSFHPDFESSASCTSTFILKGEKPLAIMATEANEKYKTNSINTLIDGLFGEMTFEDKYLGYDIDTVKITVQVDSNKYLSTFNMSYLVNQQAWIFGPQKIKIFDDNDRLIGEKVFENVDQKCVSNHMVFSMRFAANKTSYLKILIEPLTSIPSWHPGKGNKAWFFTDEIWLY